MSDDPHRAQSIVERLENLEAQNHRLKRMGLLALAVVGALALMGQATPQGQTVETREFVLKDSSGTTRAELLMVAGGPALKLYDSKHVARVTLAIYQDMPSLALCDPSGVVRLGLTDRPQDGPSLWLSGADGRPQAQLDAIGEHPRLYLQDKSGLAASIGDDTLQNLRTGGTENTSAASIALFGPGRKVIWRAP